MSVDDNNIFRSEKKTTFIVTCNVPLGKMSQQHYNVLLYDFHGGNKINMERKKTYKQSLVYYQSGITVRISDRSEALFLY